MRWFTCPVRMKTDLRWGHQGCTGWDDMTGQHLQFHSTKHDIMTKHLLAGRQPHRRAQETAAQLLLSGVFGLWTTWTCQQSQVPAGPTMGQRVRQERRGMQCQMKCTVSPFSTCFYWAVKWMALLRRWPAVKEDAGFFRSEVSVLSGTGTGGRWQTCFNCIIYNCLIKSNC